MKSNYHTHTYRCHHAAEVSDEEYVVKALETGFDELTFTDHIPYKAVDFIPDFNDRMDYEQIDEYIESIKSLKEKFKNQISIHVGFESEFFPNKLDYYKELKDKVDILILGQHYAKCLADDYWFGSDDEKLDKYADYITEALETGLFSILAHPDYIMIGRNNFNAKCEEISHRLGQVLERTQIPAELNLSGLIKDERLIDGEKCHPYPYRKMWEILAQYNIKVIFGYDAHKPQVLTYDYLKEQALDIVGDLNLNIIDSIEL